MANGGVDANLVGALKLHLPKLLMVAKGQFNIMIGNVEAMASLAVSIDPGSLSATAAACLIPIGGSIETAVVDIETSASASLQVFGEVGIN